MTYNSKIVFFGGSDFSVFVLEELKLHGILPNLIITTPDKPKGRKLVLTPTPVKIWAQSNNIEVINPKSLKNPSTDSTSSGQEITVKEFLSKRSWDLFLVASYGKIIPKDVFDIPSRKTLNIHPSMLPKYRGASPIQSQILNDEKEIGVTIMQIDEGMDTGPLLIQKKISPIPNPSPKGKGGEEYTPSSLSLSFGEELKGEVFGRRELEKILAIEGARLFAHILPKWLSGAIDPIMQDESKATLCQKIEKEMGELQIDPKNLPTGKEARQDLLKIKAFEEWPTAYFFIDTPKRSESDSEKKRIIITDATLQDGSLKILKVIPEGKKEMLFEDFLRGLR